MADSVQPLAEFLQNLVEDLQAGAISPQEALAASTQYTYLREALVNNYSQLAQAATTGDDELKSTLQNVFTQLINRLNNLPSFQNQSPDDPLSEEEVRSTGALREAAIQNVKADGEKKLTPLKEKRRAFIHELVGKFSSTMPTGAPSEEAIGKSVDRALSAAAQEATSTQTKERFSELLVAAATVTGTTPITKTASEKLIKEIASSIDTNTEYVTEVKKVVQSEKEIFTTLFTHPETTRPDVLVDILLHAPPTEKKEDVIVRALKLADVAGSLDAHKGPLPPSKNFFHAGNARGAAKGAQQAADGILSLLGEPLREIILKEKINGTLRNMFTNTQSMIDRLGENFVRSSVFAQILQGMTKSLNDKPSASQARGIFDDVFSSVFKGPLNNFTTGGTKEQLLNFFELARANANAPANQKFLPNGASPWNFILDKKQQSFRQRSGGLLGWLPTFGLGGLGAWANNILTAGFDRSTSFIFSGTRIPNQLSSSRRASTIPTPLFQDMPLLIAIVVTVTIVLMFAIQSPLNATLLNYSAKVSALLASLSQQDQTITNEVICTDCKWPTTGCISQGPVTPFDSHSAGIDSNAIDIAATLLTPVIAIADGVVIAQNDGCLNIISPTCGDGYGNWVMIDHGGKKYRYAHLAKGSVIANGLPVSKGTKIGLVDSSGSSTGSHLHFELVAGQAGSVNDVLPVVVPACVGQYETSSGPNCPSLMGGRDKSCVSIN